MRQKIALMFFLVLLLGFSGCGDDESGPSFATEPEARAENDTSGKGVYKGVFIGSSGYVKVNLDNLGDSVITLTLNLDGTSYELGTDSIFNEAGFQGYFTDTIPAGPVRIGFYTNTDGSSFGFFDVTIPGHPDVSFLLFKEKSNVLVRCFEGTFSGSDAGTINFLFVGDEWKAITRSNAGTSGEDGELEGTLNGNTLVCDCDMDGDGTADLEFTGTLSGNSASGTWSGDGSGTWKAKRTL